MLRVRLQDALLSVKASIEINNNVDRCDENLSRNENDDFRMVSRDCQTKLILHTNPFQYFSVSSASLLP